MNTDDLHSLSGAFAIDAVDDVERARFEAHLRGCIACQQEVRTLRAAAGELALDTTAPAPASLRASVLLEISSARTASPTVEPHGSTVSLDLRRGEHTERTRRRLGPWLASVAAAAAIIVGGVLWHPFSPGQEQGSPQLTATQQILKAKDAQRFETRVGAATATVVRSASLNKAVLVAVNLPSPPTGKTYELWLQQGRTMVKAGFMPGGRSNTILLQGNAATAAGAGITLEPTGGSAKPSLPPVALISFA